MRYTKFKDQHPEYARYDVNGLIADKIPSGVAGMLQGTFVRYFDGEQNYQLTFQQFVQRVQGHVPMETTSNWGRDWLVNDLGDALDRLVGRPERFFDAIPALVDRLVDAGLVRRADAFDDVNQVLQEHDVAFELRWVQGYGGGEVQWVLRADASIAAQLMEQAAESVAELCRQTRDHLEQARRNLDAGTERAHKDAVRDSLSAVESFLKRITGTNDIKDATSALRNRGDFGPDFVVKDALSMWDRVHATYPDVRHGNPTPSTMTVEEAIYIIERMSAFISYVARRSSHVGLT